MAEVAAGIGATRLDQTALFDYLVLGDAFGVERWRTLLAGIRRVPPGWSLHVDRRSARLEAPGRRPISRPGAETPPDFWSAVQKATARAVEGHHHVAVLVSGGLDSAVVAAAAIELDLQVVLATTDQAVMTEGEQQAVQELVDWAGAAHVRGRWAALIPVLDTVNQGATHPRGGLYAGLFDDVATELVKHGASIVATGDGADDLVGDPGLALADAISVRDRGGVVAATAGILRAPSGRAQLGAFATNLAPLAAKASPAVAQALGRVGSTGALLLEDGVIARLSAARRRARIREWQHVPRGRLQRHVAERDVQATAEALFALGSASLPRACPFRDSELLDAVEWAGGWAPAGHRGRSEKWLLRSAAAGHLPESVRRPQKLGRLDLQDVLLRREEHPILQRLDDVASRLQGFLACSNAADLVDRAADDTSSWVRLLCLESFLRHVDHACGRPVEL